MSRRVLVLMDDFQEAQRLEAQLKKVGFDVIFQVTEAGLQDLLLSFRPELVFVAGRGAKLSASSVGEKLKDAKNFHGKVIMGIPKGEMLTAEDFLRVRVDRVVDLPLNFESLLTDICEVFGLDSVAVLEKMRKAAYSGTPEVVQKIRGGETSKPATAPVEGSPFKTSLSSEDRQARYDRILHEEDPGDPEKILDRGSVRKAWADVLKKDPVDERSEEELDALKREFAKALFTDKDNKK